MHNLLFGYCVLEKHKQVKSFKFLVSIIFCSVFGVGEGTGLFLREMHTFFNFSCNETNFNFFTVELNSLLYGWLVLQPNSISR